MNSLHSEYYQLLPNLECVPKGVINDHVHVDIFVKKFNILGIFNELNIKMYLCLL
jgi:hypothetical protein